MNALPAQSKDSYHIVVLISGNGSNLQAIINAIETGKINGKIVLVISNRADAYGLERARKAHIPVKVLSTRNSKQNPKQSDSDRKDYDAALLTLLEEQNPDLIVLAGFMRILTAELVDHYPWRIINIHPALLPKYRGLHTHERVLAIGEREHGACVHFVTTALDSGPIIAQAKLDILPHETPATLKSRVQALEHQLYPQVIGWLAAGRITSEGNTLLLDGNPIPASGVILPALRKGI